MGACSVKDLVPTTRFVPIKFVLLSWSSVALILYDLCRFPREKRSVRTREKSSSFEIVR